MVKGEEAFQRFMTKTVPERIRRAAMEALEESADIIVQKMKFLVPEHEGKLRDSIGWTWGELPKGAVLFGTVGGGKDWLHIKIYAGNKKTIVTNKRGVQFQNAKLQEFGTREMKANPYFYPAWRTQKRGAKSRLTRRINKEIKALNNG
ncbi:hypothetical protein PsAD2_04627 [Pseudovibrio axinellae]|uniref:Phage protein, HK97 gp10 family n=1 Tax=Pseudovibrio axinellae TaxID=989403 RepID=A0A161X7D1_9HYPH|nr:HK97-gp10 family putative phage morphogenesis protein [Pseudovibrio axinellae]KZL04544.1 hypothetical protein PsAD2_04627 [Pseudovibrio axinellae]SEQ73662.1 phage protein, HK97 gp10 family [Pseudovibrio axinellae]